MAIGHRTTAEEYWVANAAEIHFAKTEKDIITIS
jgi:hypothetical protein